jgi:hypothetical protein
MLSPSVRRSAMSERDPYQTMDPREEFEQLHHDHLERDCDEEFIPEQTDEIDDEDINEGDIDSWDDGQPDEAQEWHDFDPDC